MAFSMVTGLMLTGNNSHNQSASKSKEGGASELSDEDVKRLSSEADAMYGAYEIDKMYNLLIPYKDCQEDELLWRLARAARYMGKKSKDKAIQKQFIYEAFHYAERALELNEQNYNCHKWFGAMLAFRTEYEGIKKRISSSISVRDHFLRVLELNPKDAITHHSLGYWCFEFADLPWYQRKVASLIFATPPTSTYEEALKYFLDAEEIDDGFYNINLMMIGKTYIRMKNNSQALKYLVRARDYNVKSADDEEARDKALELMRGIGISHPEQHQLSSN